MVDGLCLGEGEYRLVMSGTVEGEPFTAAQECEMEYDADEESKGAERIGARIRKLIQCMQEQDMN